VMKDVLNVENGEAKSSKLDNFRFKAYLKSNLERLYCDEEGKVIWIDKSGTILDLDQYRTSTQALVPMLNTIGKEDSSYRRILESGEPDQSLSTYNYEKFFHAMRVANRDKWDDAAPTYTSYRPLGNQWNRTGFSISNAKVSDQVRQFAIDWYLDKEVEKLTIPALKNAGQDDKEMQDLDGRLAYGDELYDEALFYAVEKAKDYLEPFFRYDLDEIYSILWDGECDGGTDRDLTTVSADEAEEKFYYGVSQYLPYGTYIVVEQQPQYAKLNDYKNKHYRIDVPKEVIVPSVYMDYESFYQSPSILSDYYGYDGSVSKEEVEAQYMIRLCGEQIQEGGYVPAFVPWSMEEPQDEQADLQPLPTGESTYRGYAGIKFRDIWYQARLRIEKLDAQTHENILFDDARFSIYSAERDTAESGDGTVKFYEEDTMISGSEDFLESVGATQIVPMVRNRWDLWGPGNLYTGIVPAGTPVFKEEDKIYMRDLTGAEVGEFSVFTTLRDARMRDDVIATGFSYGNQNVGYLETPEPLTAGVYVLVETKAPDGYARTRPIAVEVYSDEIGYYQEGNRNQRVVAAIYDQEALEDQAVIYAENTPIELQVEKRKESSADMANTTEDKTVTWKLSGRVDGSLAQIGGNPDYEYAYRYGDYQGYAWKKGTLEYLTALKHAGKQVQIVYDEQLFSGYGYITETLKSADDENPYVVGAQMILYEAIALRPSGDTDDYSYEGLTVERNLHQEVTRIYTEDERDILYYTLDDLDVFRDEWVDGQRVRYGYDKDYRKISLNQLEEERRNHQKTDADCSMVVFRKGVPYLELTGGDFTNITYSALNHSFYGDFAQLKRDRNGNYFFSEGMVIYHLDEEGYRDSLVDPQTGMAYVVETVEGNADEMTVQVLVWPVTVSRDSYGNVIARDKITTYRIATVGENEDDVISADYPESGYITGTWENADEQLSHRANTIVKNQDNQNMNEEILLVENSGQLGKTMNPIVDRHGRVSYYQKSNSVYQQKTPLYDRDGDFVRYKESDLVEAYNSAGYMVKDAHAVEVISEEMTRQQGEEANQIFHRQGESYILENTWITGEMTPNDPFQMTLSRGQPDVLKRVPAGTYIMEEVAAPAGYLKGFPKGIVVNEVVQSQETQMVDYSTKIMVGKIDGPDHHTYRIMDMLSKDAVGRYRILGQKTEGKSAYSYAPLSGARLVLSSRQGDWNRSWTTQNSYHYMEEVPVGVYKLEEINTPEGFVTSDKLRIEVENTREVQNFMIYNDHTKVEFEKYMLDGQECLPVNNAGFTLYKAKVGPDGQVIYEEERPQYEKEQPIISWKSTDGAEYRGFIVAFEEMYQDYGIGGETVSWVFEGENCTAVKVRQDYIDASDQGGSISAYPTTAVLLYRMEDGRDIRITVYQQQDGSSGRDFIFEYQFDYTRLEEVNPFAVSYMTLDGMMRLDYLPVGEAYVLVETEVPEGFAKSEDLEIRVCDTADIQRYSVLNQESSLMISKVSGKGHRELPGAHMALYRAGESGELVRDTTHLAAQWVSGMDGVYTELDEINRRIPDGYQVGDLRPHTLRRLPDGEYYLVELQSPDYYTMMEPIKIIYAQQDEISLIRVSNEPVRGEIYIQKTDSENHALSGAIFQLAAYLENQLLFTEEYSEHDGELLIKDLPVGVVMEDGGILPYQYVVKEVVPPEGYAATLEQYTFSFKPKRLEVDSGQLVSYEYREVAREEVKIENEKTRIRLQKAILESMLGDVDLTQKEQTIFVEGAGLALYHVMGRDEQGKYLYDASAPIEEWITREGEATREITGLVAGQTYLLLEKNVPDGFRRMRPLVFTLSGDGRSINQFSNEISLITVQKKEDVTEKEDNIESVMIHGRYGSGVEVVVRNQFGEEVAYWMATGNGHELDIRDALQEGEVCTITETAVYSDGSREVLSKITRTAHFVEGSMKIADRRIDKVELKLQDERGNVIGKTEVSQVCPTWKIKNTFTGETEEAGHFFEKGKNYILTEITSYSDGTQVKSGSVEFTLNNHAEIQMLTVFDQLYHVVISKTDITGENEVPGAILQLQDITGKLLEEWVSEDVPHMVTSELKAGETYVLHEEAAPEGYAYASDIVFTVSEEGIVNRIVMSDKATHVRVRKTDMTGEAEVAGATLQILDKDKQVIEEWVSEDIPHDIIGILKAGESYWLHEEHAPDGYAYAADVRFTVSMDGRIDLVTMKDRKKPAHPWGDEPDNDPDDDMDEAESYPEESPALGEPETPQVPQTDIVVEGDSRIGKITAVYKRNLTGRSKYSFGGFIEVILPKLGDELMIKEVITAVGLCILGVLFFLMAILVGSKEKKWWKSGKYWMFLVLWVLVAPMETCAKELEFDANELIVTFDAFTGSGEGGVHPPEEYYEQGILYQLKSCQLVTAIIPEKEKFVEEVIDYEAVEQVDDVPQEILVEVEDQGTGVTVEVKVPIIEKEFTNWRWISGFQFPITVEEYDVGQFYLGDLIVTEGEGELFAGYEEKLLELIGVNPEYYKIEAIEWIADAWMGTDGLIYRQAMASGQKYVADCNARYGGMVVLPETPAMAWQAAYTSQAAERILGNGEASLESNQNELEGWTGVWKRYSRQIVVVSVGLFFVLLLLLGMVLVHRSKGDREDEETGCPG